MFPREQGRETGRKKEGKKFILTKRPFAVLEKNHQINKKSIFQLFPTREIHPREKIKAVITTTKKVVVSFTHHSLKLILTPVLYHRILEECLPSR